MKSSDYWRKREEKWIKQQIKEDAKQSKIIAEKYQKALDQIEKEISANWERFAGKEGVTLSDAKKMALEMDVKAFARKAKEYVDTKDFSKTANDELRLYNVTMRTSRLELLKSQIGLELIALSDEVDKYTAETLTKTGLAEATRQAGILGETVFSGYQNFVESVAFGSFQGATFSERIWGNSGALKADLDRLLIRSVTQGRNPRELARELRNLFDSSKYEAERLMRTETARMQMSIQQKSYLENDIDEFEFVAEPSACGLCKPLDGKTFKVSKMESGLNAAPMHPNCRCSTVPYMDREAIWKDIESRLGSGKENHVKTEFDKTNIESAIGKANYDKFISGLDSLKDERIKKVLGKIGSEMEFGDLTKGDKAFVRGNNVYLTQGNFDGTKYKKPMQTVIHELGHAIDNVAGGKLYDYGDKISQLARYNLSKDIKKDMLSFVNENLKEINGDSYEQVKNLKKISIFDQGAIVRKYKKLYEENPSAYSSLSDMMESTGGFIDHPLGSGHGLKYWKTFGSQEAEFFAHMAESSANEEARKVMYQLFPTASKTWDKMIDDILKELG